MAINSQKFLPQTGGGALATTRPTATLVPYKKPAGGALVKQPTPDDEEDTKPSLEEDVAAIRVTTKKIEKIIGKTLKLNKDTMRFEARTAQKDSRNENENKREKKKKGIKMPKGIKVPKMGFLDRIKNFIGTILLGRLMVLLVDFAPKIAEFVKFISPVASFIGNVVGGIADTLATAITFGYKVKDKVEEVSKNLFGEEGLQKFKDFQGHFTKFMNLAMIAIMVGATAANDAGVGRNRGSNKNQVGIKGGRNQAGRVTRGGTSPQAARRFADRYGRDAAIKKFGQEGVESLGGRYARSAGTNLARKGAVALLGKGGTKAGLKILKNFIAPVVKRIPIIGGLIDFALNFFVFKEPIGRAAFAAIGSTIFGALGATAGSIIPVVGNIVGGALGGLAGDAAGKWLYDTFFDKKKPVDTEDKVEKKEKGGVVGEEEYEDEMRKRARSARVHKIMPSRDDHMTTGTQAASATRGKRTGNVFNRLFSFMTDSAKTVANFVNPFDKIKKAVKNLRKSNSGILSKIMALGADLIAGKKPDGKSIKDIIKSLVTFFDAAVPAPVNLLRGILQKLADGGYIIETPQQRKSKLRNLTTLVERKLLMDVTRDTTQALNVIKGIKGDEKKSPGNTAASSSSSGSYGTGSMLPGTRLPSAGATLAGSDKLASVTGQSGTVKYGGQEGSRLDISYSPFAQSDIEAQASKGGIVITSGKGYRRGTGTDHKGYDIGADFGTPMYAYLDGEVTHSNTQLGGPSDGGYGYWVVWKDDPHGAYHFFGHLDRPPALSPGTKFKAGALLANVGGSGNGSLTKYLPHLHWEISTTAPNTNGQFTSYVDPGQWINTHGAQKKETQVATNAPTNNAADVSQQASYEETGTTVAVIENTEYVRVPAPRRGSTSFASRSTPAEKQVIKPA